MYKSALGVGLRRESIEAMWQLDSPPHQNCLTNKSAKMTGFVLVALSLATAREPCKHKAAV